MLRGKSFFGAVAAAAASTHKNQFINAKFSL